MKTITMTHEEVENNENGYVFNEESEEGLCVLINGEWLIVELE